MQFKGSYLFFIFMMLMLSSCSTNRNYSNDSATCSRFKNDLYSMERCVNNKAYIKLRNFGYVQVRSIILGNINNSKASIVQTNCSLNSSNLSSVEVCFNNMLTEDLKKDGYIPIEYVRIRKLGDAKPQKQKLIERRTQPIVVNNKPQKQKSVGRTQPIVVNSKPQKQKAVGRTQPIVVSNKPQKQKLVERNRHRASAKKSILSMCASLKKNFQKMIKENKEQDIVSYSKKKLDQCLIKQEKLLLYLN